MYLKSLSIKNYRKFREPCVVEFAHGEWTGENPDIDSDKLKGITEEYISQSTSLIVGKNNAGKSTVFNLLRELQNTKSGKRDVFKCTDFNIPELHEWYKKYIEKNEQQNEPIQNFPKMEFKLTLGIDDINDYISNLAGIIEVGELVNKNKNMEIMITALYEVADQEAFEQAINTLRKKYIENQENRTFNEIYYREFLSLFCGDYYQLNYYSGNGNTLAEDFSLSQLLKVKTIEANTVKDKNTLSKAYNKIVSTYAKTHDMGEINKKIRILNDNVKNMVDTDITDDLESVIESIESSKNLKMNLYPDVTLEKVFANNIIYEYRENDNDIPETQFGMGYTNLMVIIANIVDYIDLYNENDINSAINLLCIEEPETFMHPQMQELFIKNISEAVAILLNKKSQFITFQMVITTHSSHILNSKIQSGNSLDNIIYLGSHNNQTLVKNIKDNEIIMEIENSRNDKKIVEMTYEYIKKYLRLELSDIFFADAVILVEGLSEETYLRYLLDNSNLNNHHIKVYRIDGTYMNEFFSLLKTIDIKTIIYTDLDLARSADEKEVANETSCLPKTNLQEYMNNEAALTTNPTIASIINSQLENGEGFNEKLISIIGQNEGARLLDRENISVYCQGKISGNYATSFEEAIILTNAKDKYAQPLIDLLKSVGPRSFKEVSTDDLSGSIIKNSYRFQRKLADKKSKFISDMIYYFVTKDDFQLKIPAYIQAGLDELCIYFGVKEFENKCDKKKTGR
ncbi:AAA family ATPase [Limosilactobacillus sp. RRLNB_1_1]|uniref:AAA family ATPase n=1 Tax=Limosilactobacillus albertensis TaxID=2759752 RepID=A0A7W3Y7U2_9LACO|nr:AAA family ATPase [Limosilactobacillus albertensis]MBB1068698.1 AAA family ATPase [Limosilactobacillus albertensis]MCD7118297.1 AAA family ATPase [Limosilactobacillus albertensis]MCD7129205.1 AAA family ATPase [Limosilactobacillus albertensis]